MGAETGRGLWERVRSIQSSFYFYCRYNKKHGCHPYQRAGGTRWFGLIVLTFRGSEGIGNSVGDAGSGAPSKSMTTIGQSSSVVVSNVDFQGEDGAARKWRLNAGSISEVLYLRTASPQTISIYCGYHTDVVVPGTYSVGLSTPTGQDYTIVAVEVKGKVTPVISRNISFVQ